MRQVFKANCPVAWIGDSAPIPEGWHSDLSTALEAAKAAPVDGEFGETIGEIVVHGDPAPAIVTKRAYNKRK